MEFGKMLASFNAPAAAQTKTASADNTKQQLASAVEATKVASAVQSTDAVEALMKTAATLAENEKTAELVHAHMSGRAFAQGAMEVFAAADAAAQKVAAENPRPQPQAAPMQKSAAEQGYEDTMVKAAAEQGYHDTMTKAAAEYNQGYETAVNDAVNAAATEFYKGAQEAMILIQAARSQKNG
jgi:primosomal protein N''